MTLGYKGLTQPIASTHPSFALTQCNLHDDATCTTCHHASTSPEVRLRNPIATCFHVKQPVRSRCMFCVILPPPDLDACPASSSLCHFCRQTEAWLVLRTKPRNRCGDFEAQITKPELSILRHKLRNHRP
jgi:hypothetical protein